MKLTCDLRHEPDVNGHDWTSNGSESRYEAVFSGSLLRDGPWLSQNARRQMEEMKGADWVEPLKLADRIEAGGAWGNETEHDILYETYPDLIDTVIDLLNMVSRRDEAIADLNRRLDDVARDALEMARGDQARDNLMDFAALRAPEPAA